MSSQIIYTHVFRKKADLETDEPYDMVMWYRECSKAETTKLSSSDFLGFGLVQNKSLKDLDKILGDYWSEKQITKAEAIKKLEDSGLKKFKYLLSKFDAHEGHSLKKSCLKGGPIEKFAANIQLLGGEFEVRGSVHACPYRSFRFE